jgi:nicotinamide mononucleotide adenylyltransferase
MMFGEATPTPNQFMGFWLSLGLATSVATSVVTLIIMIAGKKQKREVSFEFTPASKSEFDAMVQKNEVEHTVMHGRITKFENNCAAHMAHVNEVWSEKLDAKLAEIARDAKEDRGLLHDRINEVLVKVSELRGKITKL